MKPVEVNVNFYTAWKHQKTTEAQKRTLTRNGLSNNNIGESDTI